MITIFLSVNKLSAELNLYVGQLTRQQKEDSVVQHALSVQRALTMGNYHSLFKLYMGAPKMGGYIMDHLIARERAKALIVISKASVARFFRPTLISSCIQLQSYPAQFPP